MNEDAARRYQRYYEALSRDTVAALREIAAPEMRFRDPFTDVTGVEPIIAYLTRGFDHVEEMRFSFQDRCPGGRPGVWYYRWVCTIRAKRLNGGRPLALQGMSEVRFDEAARVAEHVDHWDAASQFYRHVPVLGWAIERVRRRLGG